MTTVILDVRSLSETLNDFSKTWKTAKAGPPRISFDSVELLFRLLTAKRWALIRAMTGAGPITIREAARRVKRDVKSVHGDVHILLNAGILQRTEKGKVVFPFDGVHVDFMLHDACIYQGTGNRLQETAKMLHGKAAPHSTVTCPLSPDL